MKGFICCLAYFFSMSMTGFSQKVYFVYLQTEASQPFFVKMDDKVISSSAAGYLILSKLKDSTYTLTVGFPQNKWPEQQFRISLDANDHGFLIKNFGDKGWGLFDLESLAIHYAISSVAGLPKTELMQVSEFTEILAKAADDPSLRERPVKQLVPDGPRISKEDTMAKAVALQKQPEMLIQQADSLQATVKLEPKEDADSLKRKAVVVAKEPAIIGWKEDVAIKDEAANKKKAGDDSIVANDMAVKTAAPANPVTAQESLAKTGDIQQEAVLYTPSVVRKKSESSTVDGLGITYIDEYADGTRDTIRIMIANSMQLAPKQQPREEKRFLDIIAEPKEATQTNTTAKTDTIAVVKKNLPVNCTVVASDNDFLKLRKKMAAETTDEAMVNEAIKTFRSKCFTVLQVKNLSTLFLNDAGKYKFFDAAYMHVPDSGGFASLQAELKDEYYINRFRAMLR